MSPATAALRAEARADDLDLGADVQDPKQASLKKDIRDGARQLAAHCAAYRGAVNSKAIWQIASTAVPFLLIVAAMIATANTNYWLTLLLAIPGGGLLVRFFTIQHDCGHGSFFTSRPANDAVGRLISVLTVTPFGLWRREHAQHHATSGHLEKRGVGDITTLTIAEFQALTPNRKFLYRLYRNPIFLFGIGVPFFFMVLQRLPWGHPYPSSETWKSVMGNNAGMLVFYGTLGWFIGYSTLFFVVWPLVHVAAAVGGWLFFIQHQFEDTHWERADDWSFQVAALHGSSFYDLHPVLNWFTGSIGLHHIHHLNSMIPNYRLKDCLGSSAELANLNRLTLWESLQCANLKLWDETNQRLVTFAEARS